MAVDGFDITELEEFNSQLVHLGMVQFPKETKTFLRKEATKVNRMARKSYKSETKKHTGNLLSGLTRGKPYIYNGDEYQIRAKNTAPHAHLIEYGHRLTKMPVTNSAGELLYIDTRSEKRVEGKHVMGKAYNEFKPIFPNDVEVYIDDLLEKGLH